ncbi:MAG: hypothetical protein IPL33_21100 [Sphingobacteriales bacterium]|nr:hypothetical protein [Sphingobacteriales bacterium]
MRVTHVLPLLPVVISGDILICAGDPIPTLLVTAASGTMVNWYNTPTNGTAITTGWSFTTTQAGIYYAEAVSVDVYLSKRARSRRIEHRRGDSKCRSRCIGCCYTPKAQP